MTTHSKNPRGSLGGVVSGRGFRCCRNRCQGGRGLSYHEPGSHRAGLGSSPPWLLWGLLHPLLAHPPPSPVLCPQCVPNPPFLHPSISHFYH